MEGFGVILFLIAIVVSLFDQSRKGKGTGTPGGPPTRRPGPMGAPRPTRQLPRPEPESERQESAADLVPEDFWAELTGQRRRVPEPAPAPRPTPGTAPAPRRSSWDEGEAGVEERSLEVVREQPQALDAYRRPETVREPLRVVSLETAPLSPDERHAAFQRRLAATQPAAAGLARQRGVSSSLRERLASVEALRESFVLQEVFGPPKGLEE